MILGETRPLCGGRFVEADVQCLEEFISLLESRVAELKCARVLKEFLSSRRQRYQSSSIPYVYRWQKTYQVFKKKWTEKASVSSSSASQVCSCS